MLVVVFVPLAGELAGRVGQLIKKTVGVVQTGRRPPKALPPVVCESC